MVIYFMQGDLKPTQRDYCDWQMAEGKLLWVMMVMVTMTTPWNLSVPQLLHNHLFLFWFRCKMHNYTAAVCDANYAFCILEKGRLWCSQHHKGCVTVPHQRDKVPERPLNHPEASEKWSVELSLVDIISNSPMFTVDQKTEHQIMLL